MIKQTKTLLCVLCINWGNKRNFSTRRTLVFIFYEWQCIYRPIEKYSKFFGSEFAIYFLFCIFFSEAQVLFLTEGIHDKIPANVYTDCVNNKFHVTINVRFPCRCENCRRGEFSFIEHQIVSTFVHQHVQYETMKNHVIRRPVPYQIHWKKHIHQLKTWVSKCGSHGDRFSIQKVLND